MEMIGSVEIAGKKLTFPVSQRECVVSVVENGKEIVPPTEAKGTIEIKDIHNVFRKMREKSKRSFRRQYYRIKHERKRQIDKVCFMKWQKAKRNHEIVLPFGWIMRKKKILRKMEKTKFVTVPVNFPKIAEMIKTTFRNEVNEALAKIERALKNEQS